MWTSDETHRRLKARAAREGKTLIEYLDDLSRREAAGDDVRKKIRKRGDDFGFF